MIMPLARRRSAPLSLPVRRTALLVRIHAARRETTEAGRQVATDLQSMERSRLSILAGLRLARAALIAAGVIWSLNAPSRTGRGRRLLTIAISALSIIRTLRNVRALLTPLVSPPPRQD